MSIGKLITGVVPATVMIMVMAVAAPVAAAPESQAMVKDRDALAPCEKQKSQCMKQCDKEKTLWFFKGESFRNCSDKCDSRHAQCVSKVAERAAEERGEVRPRTNEDLADERRDDAEERRREAAEAGEEAREEADKRAKEGKQRGMEMRDRAKENRGKDDDAGKDDGGN